MRSSENSNFILSKWFLDCINEEGEAVIIYSAELCWNNIVVPYNSMLICHRDGTTSFKSRFTRKTKPLLSENMVSLTDNVFGIEGKWNKDHTALKTRIYDSEDGSLDWNCLQPRSDVFINILNRGTYNGLGYVEKLDLSIEPWKLNMNQLRWGRFNSSTDSVVWIELLSNNNKQWLWHNGYFISGAEISDKSVYIPETEMKISFTNTRVIETEKKIFNVVRSLISYFPGIKKSIPWSFLNAIETKLLSFGELKQNGKIRSKGWAIHEYVDFRK